MAAPRTPHGGPAKPVLLFDIMVSWRLCQPSCRAVPSRDGSPVRRPAARSPSAAASTRCAWLRLQDTVVYDPFFQDMPKFFGMPFKQLLAEKHPTAWVEFECGAITEDELITKFFADGRSFDGQALRRMLVSHGERRFLS